jgi:predicted DNA-binding transcriptional regulator YafY
MWKLRVRPFRGLEEMGLSVMELCALYFSRAMLVSLAGAPYQDAAERAFAKIERALPAPCRKFLDALPVAVKAKIAGRKLSDPRKIREVMSRATEAMLNHRRVTMRYDSHSSGRAKDYIVEPLRVSYADGGSYLTAYVPEYGQMRHFAIERILTVAVTDVVFAPRPLPAAPFAHSLGAFSGPPERVELEFDSSLVAVVTGREWHQSQAFEIRPNGCVLMRLDVCVDAPLRTWVLGFGANVRVLAPATLARDLVDQLERARARYFLPSEMAPALWSDASGDHTQLKLPLIRLQRAS